MSSEQTPPPAAYPPPMLIRAMRQGINVANRQAVALAGLGLIILSVPAGFASPSIPVGLPMAIVGAVLLGSNAVWARQWLDAFLGRHPRLEKSLPSWFVMAVSGRDKRTLAE